MPKQIKATLKIDDKGTATVKKVSKSIKGMEKQSIKSSKAMTKHMKLATVALVAFGAAAAIAFGKKSIDAASNLQEVMGKFSVVFRDQINMANEFSDTLVDSYGLSERAAKQYLSSVQDLLKPMGMASDAAARMSNEVVKLSVDLGSFNNLGTEKVMMDMQSALVGNFETMKKYGVILNETVVKAEAYRLGLAQEGDLLDANTKAQAAYSLMVRGSADAIGDWARTMGSYANQVKQFWSNIEGLMATLAGRSLESFAETLEELNKTFKDPAFIANLEKFADGLAGIAKYLPKITKELFESDSKLRLWIAGIAKAILVYGIFSTAIFKGTGFLSQYLNVTNNLARASKGLNAVWLLSGPIMAGVAAILVIDFVSGLVKAETGTRKFKEELSRLNSELERWETIAKKGHSFWNWIKYGAGHIMSAEKRVEALKKQIKELKEIASIKGEEGRLTGPGISDAQQKALAKFNKSRKEAAAKAAAEAKAAAAAKTAAAKAAMDYEKEIAKMNMELRDLDFQDYIKKESDKILKAQESADKVQETMKAFYDRQMEDKKTFRTMLYEMDKSADDLERERIQAQYDYMIELGFKEVEAAKVKAAALKEIDDKTTSDAIENQKKKLQTMSDMFSSMGSLFSQFSAMNAQMSEAGAKQDRSSFNRQKNLNMAQATMAGAAAAVKAMNEYPGWPGIAMAGIIGATAAVQIANISKQEFAYAKGGVFTNQIIDKPTSFNMGLMGEAGPEAIMPLTRGPGGELGVKSTGGQQPMNVSIRIDAMDSESFFEFTRKNPQAIAGPIIEQMQRGNLALNNIIRSVNQ